MFHQSVVVQALAGGHDARLDRTPDDHPGSKDILSKSVLLQNVDTREL